MASSRPGELTASVTHGLWSVNPEGKRKWASLEEIFLNERIKRVL